MGNNTSSRGPNDPRKTIQWHSPDKSVSNEVSNETSPAGFPEKSAPANDWLANISHEIKTPLNAIIGFTELLLDDDLTMEQRDALEHVEESADSLLYLLQDVLDFYKITANKVVLCNNLFDLETLIFQTLELIRARMTNSRVELICDVRNLPTRIYGDRMRLRQILLNLLGNAVKFTYEGEVVLKASAALLDNNLTELVISVQDTGVGFSKEKASQLFDPSFQDVSDLSEISDGVGLGLAICQQLAKRMGGFLTAQSDRGQGSTFELHLFLESQESTGKVDDSILVETSKFLPRNVLIADDNKTTAHVLAHHLKSTGANISVVHDSRVALSKLDETQYDAVLLDLELEPDGGEHLAKTIAEKSDGQMPLIVPLLSLPKQRFAVRDKQHLFTGYLLKPVRRRELLRRLNSYAENRDRDITPIPSRTFPTLPRSEFKVLVVEDDVASRSAMAKLLDRRGHLVEEASNGSEAIRLCLSNPYDVIFMDLKIPEGDGLNTAKLLRARGISTPIVGMTASSDKKQRAKCLEFGMNDYLPKPISLRSIDDVLRRNTNIALHPTEQHRLRIMLIGQDENTISLIKKTLIDSVPAAQIRVPRTPTQGCVEIGSFLPHLLVIDRDILGVDIFELISYLKKEERFANVQILLTTSQSGPSKDFESMRNLGVSDVLSKPFGRKTFTDMIRMLLGDGSPFKVKPQGNGTWSVENGARKMDLEIHEYKNLLERVIDTASDRIRRIEDALNAHDLITTSEEAHALRGSALNFKLDHMAHVATKMEQGALTGNQVASETSFEELKKAIDSLKNLVLTNPS